ncbi:GNAT family N-acetyltransferase [Paenibacillus macerans]|uniref:GNAT family N-acetyltransferase n=1 Tax=Paenibacillus macerans TaxID=44252 RepID=UPI003D317867
MELETERLMLREFTMEDEQEVHVYASDPFVVRHMVWGPNSEEETREYLARMREMQNKEPREGYELAAVLKATGQLIGGCGLYLSGFKQGEIGYCFNPLFWRQGYATEAARALLALGFQELGLHRIYATCRPDNSGSAKVMQKIGMTYEGHMREHLWHNGKWHDSFQYSILSSEYGERLGMEP